MTTTDGVPSQLAVLLGVGDGTFESPVLYPTSQGIAVAADDLDGDGDADVVTG